MATLDTNNSGGSRRFVSAGAFKQVDIVGPSTVSGVSNIKVFDGSSYVDPQTGAKLSDIEFAFSAYQNGAATTRKGVEFASKTALRSSPKFGASVARTPAHRNPARVGVEIHFSGAAVAAGDTTASWFHCTTATAERAAAITATIWICRSRFFYLAPGAEPTSAGNRASSSDAHISYPSAVRCSLSRLSPFQLSPSGVNLAARST